MGSASSLQTKSASPSASPSTTAGCNPVPVRHRVFHGATPWLCPVNFALAIKNLPCELRKLGRLQSVIFATFLSGGTFGCGPTFRTLPRGGAPPTLHPRTRATGGRTPTSPGNLRCQKQVCVRVMSSSEMKEGMWRPPSSSDSLTNGPKRQLSSEGHPFRPEPLSDCITLQDGKTAELSSDANHTVPKAAPARMSNFADGTPLERPRQIEVHIDDSDVDKLVSGRFRLDHCSSLEHFGLSRSGHPTSKQTDHLFRAFSSCDHGRRFWGPLCGASRLL